MKRLNWLFFILFLVGLTFTPSLISQQPGSVLIFNNDPSGTGIPRRLAVSNASGNLFYTNPLTGQWTQVGSGGGGGGGLGSSPCSSISVTSNAATLVFSSTVNCNYLTITAATTITLPTPSGGASGEFQFQVINSGPVTGTNIIYAGATEVGLPTSVDSSSNNSVTSIVMHWANSEWIYNGGQSATASNLTTGQIYTAGANAVPVAATYSNLVSLFSGCSGMQYLGYDGNCHTASGGSSGPFLSLGAITSSGWSSFGNTSTTVTYSSGVVAVTLTNSNTNPAINGVTESVSGASSYTHVFGIQPQWNVGNSNSHNVGVFFTDGTKASTCYLNSSNGAAENQVLGYEWSNATTQGSAYSILTTNLSTPQNDDGLVYFQLIWNQSSSTMSCNFSRTGQPGTFLPVWSDAGPYLTPTGIGHYLSPNYNGNVFTYFVMGLN